MSLLNCRSLELNVYPLIRCSRSIVFAHCLNIVAFLLFTLLLSKTGLTEWRVPLAYAIARVISGVVNYVLNSKMVFKASGARTFVGYFILWLIILGLGSGGSYLIHDLLGLPGIVSKLCGDIPLFLLSYWAQRELIFKKKAGNI